MPATLELGLEPNLHHAIDQLATQEVGGQAQHIGIVVAAAHLRGDAVVTGSRTDTVNFVSGDAHADARAADQDAAVHTAFADRLGHLKGVIGVVDTFATARTHVYHFVVES